MKVLWLSVTPSLYGENPISHNGGGWIESLERLIRNIPEIELGIAFIHPNESSKVVRNHTTYYPMAVYDSKWKQKQHKFFFKQEEIVEINACLKVIEDFQPDLIHVFGSEWSFGLVAKHTEIPVVIHIQGLAAPYFNALLPPRFSVIDYITKDGANAKRILNNIIDYYHFKYRAEREVRILEATKYFMGRTEWDKSVSKLLSPHSKYYYCSEVLRPEFIESKDRWNPKDRGHKIIVSTISSPLYKGGDVILTTAQLLKNAKIDFEWSVIGASNFKSIEQKIGIMAKDVNVILNGTLSAKVLKERLLNADVFVHPSYIDNSPNSICEAQFLGLPVISTNVGGISSLIPSDDYGLLFPANDPYRACSLIMSILNNKKLSLKISANSRSLAEKRHDQTTIISDLITTYKRITDNEC